jgi:hypothetical protein
MSASSESGRPLPPAVAECPAAVIDLDALAHVRYPGLPASLLAAGRALLNVVEPRPEPGLLPLADLVEERTAGRFAAEFRGWAAAVGVDPRELILANVSYDLFAASLGCSAAALATAEGPVLARNMDWWPEEALARASVVLTHARGGRTVFANAGWPGSVGAVTGLSAAGFAVSLNAASGLEPPDPAGYPVLLHLRRTLEDAGGFAEAVEMLSRERLAASGLFTVVGRENAERAVVERSPTRSAVRRPVGDEPLICTNDYRRLGVPAATDADDARGLFRSACWRFDALLGGCRTLDPRRPATDAELLRLLAGPPVAQQITAQHVILRPRSGTARMWVPAAHVAVAG